MKICQEHWAKLRSAIEDRGLGRFVAKSGKAAAENVAAQMRGTETKENYDPLMSANFAIWGNALESFGVEIAAENAPCPLCVLDRHAAECKDATCKRETGADWIAFAADGELENARELGLVGEPN